MPSLARVVREGASGNLRSAAHSSLSRRRVRSAGCGATTRHAARSTTPASRTLAQTWAQQRTASQRPSRRRRRTAQRLAGTLRAEVARLSTRAPSARLSGAARRNRRRPAGPDHLQPAPAPRLASSRRRAQARRQGQRRRRRRLSTTTISGRYVLERPLATRDVGRRPRPRHRARSEVALSVLRRTLPATTTCARVSA